MLTLVLSAILFQPGQSREQCQQGAALLQKSTWKSTQSSASYGITTCPCVGLDHVEGHLNVDFNGSNISYPASLGSHCYAWDNGRSELQCGKHQTPGKGHDYCRAEWCYVDPCDCNITSPPQHSVYFPDATWRGKPLLYSYDTCGSKDTWSQSHQPTAEASAPSSLIQAKWPWSNWSETTPAPEEDVCGQRPWNSDNGDSKCQCTGIAGQTGEVEFTIDDAQFPYPSGAGATCAAWDLHNHPECQGEGKPGWCREKWCFVDPCACGLEVPPKRSWYIPEATVDHRPVYYSYDACGAQDEYTVRNADACVNQIDEEGCLAVRQQGQQACAWGGPEMKCLGKELLDVCELTVKQIQDWSWWGFTGGARESITLWRAGAWGLGSVFAILFVAAICLLARLDQTTRFIRS